jgi:hypothetical protein
MNSFSKMLEKITPNPRTKPEGWVMVMATADEWREFVDEIKKLLVKKEQK